MVRRRGHVRETAPLMQSTRHISFISVMEGAPWGGSEELWSQAAARLQHAGHSVTASVKGWNCLVPAVDRLENIGVQVIRRNAPNRLRRLGHRLGVVGSEPFLHPKSSLAVISSGHHTGGLDWMRACERRSIPYVTIAQAAGERWWPDDSYAIELADALERARSCCFVSSRNLDLVRKQLVGGLSNACIVRNPYNVSYSVPASWPAEQEPLRLACVARVDVCDKGQDLIIDVLSQPKWRQRNISVSFFGFWTACTIPWPLGREIET